MSSMHATLEHYELVADGDLSVIVNITDVPDLREVRRQLGTSYRWGASSVTVLTDETGPSEWMTLHGAVAA